MTDELVWLVDPSARVAHRPDTHTTDVSEGERTFRVPCGQVFAELHEFVPLREFGAVVAWRNLNHHRVRRCLRCFRTQELRLDLGEATYG